MKKTIITALALASLGALDSCDPDVLDNPSFDLWCGDTLCGWDVTKGEIERVPTWHERDFGVALHGPEVVLSQLVEASASSLPCLTFEVIADASGERADLELQLDFGDDGTIDHVQPIATANWQSSRFNITTPTWFDDVRIGLAKYGDDDAVLAQLRALSDDIEACTAPPIVIDERPSGAPCDNDAECWADVCNTITWLDPFEGDPKWGDLHAQSVLSCGECETSADCQEGEVCGLGSGSTDLATFTTCGPPARHVLGEHCLTDDECASGICGDGQCAECRDTCGAGTCARPTTTVDVVMPFQCDPQQALRLKGEGCLQDADCASGVCSAAGILSLCMPDGRRCTTDADCPVWFFDARGACTPLGADDGTCQ